MIGHEWYCQIFTDILAVCESPTAVNFHQKSYYRVEITATPPTTLYVGTFVTDVDVVIVIYRPINIWNEGRKETRWRSYYVRLWDYVSDSIGILCGMNGHLQRLMFWRLNYLVVGFTRIFFSFFVAHHGHRLGFRVLCTEWWCRWRNWTDSVFTQGIIGR